MSQVNWRPETEAEEAAMMRYLDPEEREVLEAFNSGAYDHLMRKPTPDDLAYWTQVVENTLALSAAITAPLTQHDMRALRVRAAEEGLTPEALAGSLLHKALKALRR
jgi:hypothetical protein